MGLFFGKFFDTLIDIFDWNLLWGCRIDKLCTRTHALPKMACVGLSIIWLCCRIMSLLKTFDSSSLFRFWIMWFLCFKIHYGHNERIKLRERKRGWPDLERERGWDEFFPLFSFLWKRERERERRKIGEKSEFITWKLNSKITKACKITKAQ